MKKLNSIFLAALIAIMAPMTQMTVSAESSEKGFAGRIFDAVGDSVVVVIKIVGTTLAIVGGTYVSCYAVDKICNNKKDTTWTGVCNVAGQIKGALGNLLASAKEKTDGLLNQKTSSSSSE